MNILNWVFVKWRVYLWRECLPDFSRLLWHVSEMKRLASFLFNAQDTNLIVVGSKDYKDFLGTGASLPVWYDSSIMTVHNDVFSLQIRNFKPSKSFFYSLSSLSSLKSFFYNSLPLFPTSFFFIVNGFQISLKLLLVL